MLRRYSRLLVALYVISDALLGVAAFGLAYLVRFSSGLIPVIKGYPPFTQYVAVLPFIAALVPLAYQFQGLYRLRRGRSRVDDFFTVFIGSIVAVVLGVICTLYLQVYYVSPDLKDRGAYEVSRVVWTLFLLFNVALTFGARELVREVLERRWRAGIGLKRLQHLVLWVSDVGRSVRFYTEVLGFEVKRQYPNAAFLFIPGTSDDHNLGLFEQPGILDPDGGPAPSPERQEITLRLGRLELAEAERLARNRQILLEPLGYLEEVSHRRAALVELAGGMQEARAELGTGCQMLGVAHRQPHFLQRIDMFAVTLDIG